MRLVPVAEQNALTSRVIFFGVLTIDLCPALDIEISRDIQAVATGECHLVEVDYFCNTPGFHTWVKEIEWRVAAFDSCEPYSSVDIWPKYWRDCPESLLALQNAHELLVIMADWLSLEITPDGQASSSETQVRIEWVGPVVFLWVPVPVVIAIKVLDEVPLANVDRSNLTCFRVSHHLGDLPRIIVLVKLPATKCSSS